MDTSLFDAHGIRFTVSSTQTDIVDAFEDLLVDLRAGSSPAVSPGPTPVRVMIEATTGPNLDANWYRVTLDDECIYPVLLEGALVSHVLMTLNARAASACRSAGDLPLHAGAVADGGELDVRPGAVLLPGASHSGKTTLAAGLALAGMRFLADEVSRVEPDTLSVSYYGKPLAMRTSSVELLAPRVARFRRSGTPFEIDERFLPPSELGGGAPRDDAPARSEVPIGSIVFPRYDDAGPLRLTPLSPAETLERLMQCTLGTGSAVTVREFRVLERLVRTAAAHELVYSQLTDATAGILAVLRGVPAG